MRRNIRPAIELLQRISVCAAALVALTLLHEGAHWLVARTAGLQPFFRNPTTVAFHGRPSRPNACRVGVRGEFCYRAQSCRISAMSFSGSFASTSTAAPLPLGGSRTRRVRSAQYIRAVLPLAVRNQPEW